MRATNDVIEDAINRGKRRQAALLHKAGGCLSVKEAANLLGISTEELEGKKSLLTLSTGGGDLRWPAFQFESGAMMDGVEKVLAAVNVDEPWAQLNFFFVCLQELGGRTPVQAIREGSVDAVVLAATHFGDHGAS